MVAVAVVRLLRDKDTHTDLLRLPFSPCAVSRLGGGEIQRQHHQTAPTSRGRVIDHLTNPGGNLLHDPSVLSRYYRL